MEQTSNKFGLTREIILEVMKEVSKRMLAIKKNIIEAYDISFSNKNLSEIIGKIMEKVAADIFTQKLGYKVVRATTDKDPDLFFTKISSPLEIKVTSTENAWTGGEFSKRPFDYLLVSWGGNFDEFFVALVHLEKNDWISHITKRYYGPSYPVKKLYERKDKIIFMGNIVKEKKGGKIKLIRENIKQQIL
jgi:folate-dependent tRNA-U54 methylase TrmFO/GidA